MKALRYHEEAREEFFHEVRFYSAISKRLGERFDKAIQAAEARAAEFPEMGSPFKYGTRRLIPKKFKFSLVYVVVGDNYRRPAKVIVANHSLPIGHQVNTSTPTAVANHMKLAQHRRSSISHCSAERFFRPILAASYGV